jgi:hypothetical protein
MKANKSAKSAKHPDAVLHGECYIFQSSLPATAQEETDLKGAHVIIANSEVTGNHHVIDRKPGVKFFKDGNRRFMQNQETTKVSCVIAERHTAIDLAPGTWEFGIAQEYDYFAEAKKNVAD